MKKTPPLQAVTQAFQNEVWAIMPEMHHTIQNLILERAAGQKPDLSVLEARVAGESYGAQEAGGAPARIGVVSLHGVLINRAGMMDMLSGATSPQAFAREVRRFADDPNVDTLVLDIDSPGGTVSGTQSAGEAVAYAAARKRVIACVNDSAYSAAYWVASQASEVVVPSAGGVGSIGVITTHFDLSGAYAQEGIKPTVLRSAELKALGQDSEAMTGKALEQATKRLQDYHAQFVHAVADGRGVTDEKAAEWATGQTWLGEEAVSLGLADRVGTLQSTLDALVKGEEPAAADAPAPAAALAGVEARASPEPPRFQPAEPSPEAAETVIRPSAASFAPAPSAQEESMNLKDILAKIEAGTPLNADERAFLSERLGEQAADPAASKPDLSQLDPEYRAIVERAQAEAEQANAKAAAAQEAAEAERSARLEREAKERARALGLPDDMAAHLQEARASMSDEGYAALEQALKAKADESALLGETGSSRDRAVAGNPQSEYQAKVQEYRAQNPSASRREAAEAVMRENPDLRQSLG